VSPILVRPVREQLEHDRVIRLLHAKYRRRYDVAMNPGAEQNAAAGVGAEATYPDLVLWSQERGHRLQGVIEVETGESVNHLEALAEWARLGRMRAHFLLYVPSGMVDVARRLCQDSQILVTEIWSFHAVGDEMRFTLVDRNREKPVEPAKPRDGAQPTAAARKSPARRSGKPASKSRRRAAAKKSARRAKKPVRVAKKPARVAKKPARVAKKPARVAKKPARVAKKPARVAKRKR